MGGNVMNNIIMILIRVFKLDREVYSEFRQTPGALSNALKIVLISSAAAGIGSIGNIGVSGIIIGSLGALINWFIWIYITYVICMKMMPKEDVFTSQVDFIKIVGLSSAVGVIRAIGIIPGLFHVGGIAGNIWMILTMSRALESELKYEDKWKAARICVFSWILMVVAAYVLSSSIKGLGF
jgi:hypothetical protein